MSISITRRTAIVRRFNPRGKILPALAGGMSLTFAAIGHAFAQAAAPANSIGAQLNTMSSEGISASGNIFTMACYAAAALCFSMGVWKLWQSRQPQNREQGHVMAGVAGLVLCGLFASAGVWVNKAAVTGSGGNATVNDTPGLVQFGAGG
ncbi:hypothetical protein [Rhodopila globiformis]|nr:hypothetical protein [Rhodopila globiformis]